MIEPASNYECVGELNSEIRESTEQLNATLQNISDGLKLLNALIAIQISKDIDDCSEKDIIIEACKLENLLFNEK